MTKSDGEQLRDYLQNYVNTIISTKEGVYQAFHQSVSHAITMISNTIGLTVSSDGPEYKGENNVDYDDGEVTGLVNSNPEGSRIPSDSEILPTMMNIGPDSASNSNKRRLNRTSNFTKKDTGMRVSWVLDATT